MALTLRNDAKKQIIRTLQGEGYPRYARLVSLFDIYLTDESDVVGYMIPNKAKIVLNQNLSIDQVSTIVRHEILHEFLTHGPRGDAFHKSHPEFKPDSMLSNIAADYEISNRGYTPADKRTTRSLILGDNVVSGLVTEDDHPEWVNLTYEEMYKKLLEIKQRDEQALKHLLDKLKNVSKKSVEDMRDEAQAQANDPDNSSAGKQRAHGLSNELDKLADKLDDTGAGGIKGGPGPIPNAAVQQERVDIAARVAQIQQELADPDAMADVDSVVTKTKRKEAQAAADRKAAAEFARRGNGGISNFKLDLKRFIDRECGEREERSYRRFNPSYEDTNWIVRSRSRYYEEGVPVINVYWDTSGSFSNPAKTAGARAAVDTLKSYERQGLIKINVFYFNTDVMTSPAGGGTDGDAVINHISETHPDNVIVITDDDVNIGSATSTVPGAVYVLFYDNPAPKFVKRLRGRKENKWYMIEYERI